MPALVPGCLLFQHRATLLGGDGRELSQPRVDVSSAQWLREGVRLEGDDWARAQRMMAS
jgi:hypothetical protein